eukprot:TRINITY_DN3838_c0_g1_i1.p1 TRINITY_DN3838_c0_g1~~TRINITY_DN3838_c0_g1_i1.p1  ORF type:complete len:374 (+),score=156.20 TRINITY_DN3838_c0_g1_i1:50-1171(+)
MRAAAMFVLAVIATKASACSVRCPEYCTPRYTETAAPRTATKQCGASGETQAIWLGWTGRCSTNVQPAVVANVSSEICEVTGESTGAADVLCKAAGPCTVVREQTLREAKTCDCPAGGLPALVFGARTECTATFNGVIKSLVAAYEQLGHLDSTYDETGYCGEGCTVWGRSTTNPTLALTLTSFKNIEAPGASGPCVGEFSGFADFYSVRNGVDEKYRRVTVTFVWSGEDITAQVSVTSPELLTPISFSPAMWGMQAYAVNCPSSKNQRACSNWSLFGHLRKTYPGRLVTKEPTFEEVAELLRKDTSNQGGSDARIEAEIQALEAYYTAHSSEVTLKTLIFEEPAWDQVEITTFFYNDRTRELLAVEKPLYST